MRLIARCFNSLKKLTLHFFHSMTFGISIGLTAVALIVERNEGLIDRTWVAGVNVTEIIIAQVVTQFFILLVQIILLVVIVLYAFKVSLFIMYIHRLTWSLSVSRSIDSWMVIIQGWFQLFWSGATCMCSEKSGFEAASGDLIIARKKLNTCTNSGATCCKILKRSWWHGILDTCNVMCIYWSTKVLVRIPLNASTAQTTTMSEGHMCL